MNNDVKVAHIISKIKGVSIPVEIAGEISKKKGVEVGLVSENSLPEPDEEPDILDNDIILDKYSPVKSYNFLISNLLREGYDLIHTHHNRSSALVSFFAHYSPISHINTQHGHAHYRTLQKFLNLCTLFYCDYFTYNSKCTEDSYNCFENLLRSGDTHRVIHNGVDLTRLGPFQKTEYGSPRSLVTASRLIRRKNIGLVLEALKTLPNFKFTIVGDGPLRKHLQTKARQMGVADRVEFAGFVQDREDVYRILSQADAFVHPSFSEGFCVAVAEAMALGLPVIVSDIPVFHEVVGDGGIFVNPHNSQSLRCTLEWLADHPQEGKRRGGRNRHRIEANFDLDDIASKYVETYRSLLKNRDSTSVHWLRN